MEPFHELITKTMHAKCVEPNQRMVGGTYGWAIHRFPINGGVTLRHVMALSLTSNNYLLKRLNQKHVHNHG